MKTKDLIARLQEADPTGEEHCCVHNADIWSVETLPAYYDGLLQIIDRDSEDVPTRGRRQHSGKKINISPVRIEDCQHYEHFVVDYEIETDRQRYEKFDLEDRRRNDHTDFEVERSIFCDWVFLKIQTIKPIPLGWVSRIKNAAESFYNAHRGPDVDDGVISKRKWPNNSYAEKLQAVWDVSISVDWDRYSRIKIEPKVFTLNDFGLPDLS